MVKLGYASVYSKFVSNKLSGKDDNRPQLKEMLNYIREDDIIVVSELDRLGRNNKEITSIMNLMSLNGIQDDKLRRLSNNLIVYVFG